MADEIKKVMLAYSGGLDTSSIVPWLKENYNCEVICFVADVGQGAEDLEGVEKKAIASGATKCIVKDLKEEFIKNYVYPTLKTGAKLTVTDRVEDAAGYDVAYTDTWVSMGDNTPLDAVRARYMPYQINRELLKKTGIPYVLHCQPAHRGYEITDDVMDDEKVSLIYDEAENRLHAQMAVLGTLISDKNK